MQSLVLEFQQYLALSMECAHCGQTPDILSIVPRKEFL